MRIRSILFALTVFVFAFVTGTTNAAPPAGTAGSLSIIGKGGKIAGECPLRHTGVNAAISGSFARVTVTQSFVNNASDKIEAVYTFPLPHDAAVDDMTIRIGERTIRGIIQTREQAQKIYDQAIQRGQTAALLDQERPNIFTQRVGNIPPGVAIDVTISYVSPLKYEDGSYEFAFPTVVGPRYIPGDYATGQSGGGFSPDTNQVPDASKVTPPVSPTRTGHDLSITVSVEAGVPIQNLRSPTHKIDVTRPAVNQAAVRLRDEITIPNRDFILRYDVAGAQISEGLLTHTRATGDGYFSFIVQPPARFKESDVTPKEIVFVLDTSGSMNGFPEDRAKQFIDTALNGLYPGDTFNVIKFSGETAILFKEPVYPTADNIAQAREFVNASWGGGGTEMMKAIRAALDPSDSQEHLRIVVFLTDGYVGNDLEILAEIRKHSNARVFAYGVGTAVNRFLIEGMGHEGRGDAEVITSVMKETDVASATQRLYDHLRSPLLTDISLDFGGLPVTDVYPTQIADLFSGRPVVVTGRYKHGAKGTITLKAKRAGDNYVREIAVLFPDTDGDNTVLANLWARAKIDELMSQDLAGLQRQQMNPTLQKQITELGLNYRLMTQFTSFVAVEERVSTEGGKPRTVQVPVELPKGVQYEDAWSDSGGGVPAFAKLSNGSVGGVPMASQSVTVTAGSPMIVMKNSAPPPMNSTGAGAGIGSGSGGGIGGGVYHVGGGAGGNRDRLVHEGETNSSSVPKYKTKDESLLASKSDAKLLSAYQCWVGLSDKSTAASACKLADGKLKLNIIFDGNLSAMTALGFVAQGAPVRNQVHGSITLDKLVALASLKEVRFMALAP